MPGVTYSDFWGPSLNAYTLQQNKAPMRNQIKRVMNREQMKVLSELATTLISGAVGDTALMTKARVRHVFSSTVGEQPGPNSNTVTTDTLVNRATTSADQTALNEFLFNVRRSPTYVRDSSGNGGPAFTAG